MENSKLKYISGILIFLCSLYSCVREEVDHTKMVVEGWIDAGKHPIVMLHTSYSLSLSEPDSTTLLDVLEQHMVLFGKVVIFDGEDSVILTGRVDTNYLPPYIYTTTKMRGEVGKSYSLHATYKSFSAKSKTIIPEKAIFDSIRTDINNQKVHVIGYANQLEIGEPYIIMARTTKDKQYQICPMGAFRASQKQLKLTINNPINFTGEGMILQTLFPQTDSVDIAIKFAKVGEAEYQFWDSYIAQNLTQGLFFVETHSNIISNIQDGNGYWCGMGASEYTISLERDSLYVYSK
ncbi:MAG: DUF4249 family protein [Paludibacteraceae bacterium]|nr:DUF4249 family protein [Paludibacteraceae bacterium]